MVGLLQTGGVSGAIGPSKGCVTPISPVFREFPRNRSMMSSTCPGDGMNKVLGLRVEGLLSVVRWPRQALCLRV